MKEPIRPMLATLVAEPFHRPGWIYEEKYDGIRALAYRRRGRTRLYSRNQRDITTQFPAVAEAIERLPGGDLVLDGEIVALDPHGVSRFQLLQRRAASDPGDGIRRVRAVFAIFDCLEAGRRTLLEKPLTERRRALEASVPARAGILMRARRLAGDGLAAYRTAQKSGWEGIIAKDSASTYEPGTRSPRWLKVKVRKESEFVVGGYTPPRGSRPHLGALLLGLFDGPSLRFVGKVGAGFTHEALADLVGRLRAIETSEPPFRPAPRIKDATWVRPRLVAQVTFAEWTSDGKLRQPSFLGLRRDKPARECTWRSRER